MVNMKSPRRNVSSDSPMEKTIGFSRAVKIGNMISLSGTAAILPDGSTAHPMGKQNTVSKL